MMGISLVSPCINHYIEVFRTLNPKRVQQSIILEIKIMSMLDGVTSAILTHKGVIHVELKRRKITCK